MDPRCAAYARVRGPLLNAVLRHSTMYRAAELMMQAEAEENSGLRCDEAHHGGNKGIHVRQNA